jgi:hypothetical protein
MNMNIGNGTLEGLTFAVGGLSITAMMFFTRNLLNPTLLDGVAAIVLLIAGAAAVARD